jgi:golgin subfamily A protein 1
LEEAHIHLHEIKSNWTSQNLTLENQLARLSRQVAEETGEKRKIIEAKEMLTEKVKQLEFEMSKASEELKVRDNKIKLMNEEIDELNSSLREIRLENEEEIEFLRSKVAFQESELILTKENVLKYSETSDEYEAQILALQKEYNEAHEKLRDSENKIIEMNQKIAEMEQDSLAINDLQTQLDRYEAEVTDKNKAIKILNQRLFDVKKTLQEEIKNNNSGSTGSMTSNQPAILIPVNVDNNSNNHTLPFNFKKSNISGPIVLDEVKFSYLKHVIFKFLTTESKHLIRPVSTLLYLTDSEEKLLEEVLEYRKSWFGKPPAMSFL